MKKYFLLSVLAVGIMCSQLAYADVIPEGQKYIPVCAQLNGMNELPKITVVAREEGPTMEGIHVWVPEEGECVNVSYKFNTLELYAVDKDTTNITEDYDPENDPLAFKADTQIEVGSELVDENDETTYKNNEYLIFGVDNSTKKLVLRLAAVTTNMLTQDILPSKPEGVEDQMEIPLMQEGPVFTDVAEGSTYYNALVYLKNEGVISGYDDGSFKPSNTINRAEFTKIVVGAKLGDDLMSDKKNCFPDVKEEWFAPFVCNAKESGIIGGYPDGKFKPELTINFAEASKILVLTFDLGTEGETDPWYKPYVITLGEELIIPETIHQFSQNITRGQMAEMVYRIKAKPEGMSGPQYNDLQ